MRDAPSSVRSLWLRLHYMCVVARETLLLNWDQSGGGQTFFFFSIFPFFGGVEGRDTTMTQSINCDPFREEAARYGAVGNLEPV